MSQSFRARAVEIVAAIGDLASDETLTNDYWTRVIEGALTEGAVRQQDGEDSPEPAAPGKPEKPARSRAQRWARAAGHAQEGIEVAKSAVDDMRDIQEEFSEWRANIPEGLASGPVGEKLDAVCELDFDSVAASLEEAQDQIIEATDTDLPKGFGRD